MNSEMHASSVCKTFEAVSLAWDAIRQWRQGDAPAAVRGGQPGEGYPVVVLTPGGRVAEEDVQAIVGWVSGGAGDSRMAGLAAVVGELLGDGDDEGGVLG